MWRRIWLAICFLLALSPLGGCGKSSGDDEDEEKKPAAVTPKEKSVPLAGKLGIFDAGRIEIPLLKDWHDSPKQLAQEGSKEESLARMGGSEALRVPAINFWVREYPDFKSVGPGDLRKFARQRREEIAEERKNKETGAKPKIDVETVTRGDFYGVEYAFDARVLGKTQDRLLLETVVDGRLYTLELQTIDGAREEYRAAVYSVAKGLKFPKRQYAPTGGSEDEEPAEETKEGEAKEDEAKEDEAKEDEAKEGEAKEGSEEAKAAEE